MRQRKISSSARALRKKMKAELIATPTARPSMLSRRLNAFEMPRIQRKLTDALRGAHR
jgi:hypothetical protein